MKRIGSLLLFVLLSTFPLVRAGESYDISFFSQAIQAADLYEGDEVRFPLLGGNHVIIVDDVGKSSVKLKVGPFIDNNTLLIPALVGLDFISRIDLDKDGDVDINIGLYSVAQDGQVHLVIQDVSGGESQLTGDVGLVDNGSGGGDSKTYVLVGIGVLIAGLLIFLLFRSRRGKKAVVDAEPVSSGPFVPGSASEEAVAKVSSEENS